MNPFDFIFKKPIPTPKTGALVDNRPASVRAARDITFGQIVAKANPVTWAEKPRSSWRTFPVRDQGQGYSCMANAFAKAHGIASQVRDGKFIEFSAADVYRRRINKPNAGMFLYDVFDIGSQGITLEALIASDKLTDSVVDRIKPEPHEEAVGKIFANDATPIYIDAGDFDTCASVLQTTSKGIISMFFFTSDEYSREIPVVKESWLSVSSGNALRHGITLVDAFTWNGQQVILAEDSAHFGGFPYRLLTREFFEKRNFGNAYEMKFRFDAVTSDRPKYTGTIASAQACYQYEGFFPLNVTPVEVEGPLTQEATRKFQMAHKIAPVTGMIGPKTKAVLSEIYGA